MQAASSAAAAAVDTPAPWFARLLERSGGESTGLDGAATGQDAATAPARTEPTGGDGLDAEGSLAFQALLVAVPTSGAEPADPVPQQDAGDASATGSSSPGTSAGWSGGHAGLPAPRDPDSGLAVAVPPGQANVTAHALAAAPPAACNTDAGTAAAQDATRGQRASPLAASLSAASVAEPDTAPEPAAAGAAREIRLELRDADSRVDLRLVERGGAIQVDVRTSDSHLAGALRDDLPALTARLEQTGMRAEIWREAPAAAGASSRMAEPASSGGLQSSHDQSRREGGGRGPRDGQPQEKRQNQPQPKPKEFSCLYTSLT
jgi:hypothetical protein